MRLRPALLLVLAVLAAGCGSSSGGVGVTGLPSDEAVLRSVVAGDGGDPSQVHTVTIGFQAVKALLARRVAGATAFWNVEGVALRRQRPDIREFRVDDFGAPPCSASVIVATPLSGSR